MHMEQLKNMKEQMISFVHAQFSNLHEVDTKELGEAVDMIKDLSEALYYCTITESMEKAEKETEKQPKYYTVPTYNDSRDIDRSWGRMYYGGQGGNNPSGNSSRGTSGTTGYYGGDSEPRYPEREFPITMRDTREGRSPMTRRMYMESKELHKDKNTKMQELEKYLQELTQDIMEMIEDASPEEQNHAAKKIQSLSSKIS